jgi:competence protein ComGC
LNENFAFFIFDQMTYKSRLLIILVSISILLIFLILNFFFFKKTGEEKSYQVLQSKILEAEMGLESDSASIADLFLIFLF